MLAVGSRRRQRRKARRCKGDGGSRPPQVESLSPHLPATPALIQSRPNAQRRALCEQTDDVRRNPGPALPTPGQAATSSQQATSRGQQARAALGESLHGVILGLRPRALPRGLSACPSVLNCRKGCAKRRARGHSGCGRSRVSLCSRVFGLHGLRALCTEQVRILPCWALNVECRAQALPHHECPPPPHRSLPQHRSTCAAISGPASAF